MGKSNSISLNGRLYDSRTGALLESAPAAEQPANFVNLAPPKPQLQTIAKRPVMDGFVRSAAQPSPAHALHPKTHKSATLRRVATKPAVKAAVLPVKPAVTKPLPVQAHQPHKSATLMRHAVAKPDIPRKAAIKPQSNTAALVAQPAHGVTRKRMSSVVDDSRMVRAISTPKHMQVNRFTKQPTLHVAKPHLAVVPVTPAPRAAATHVTPAQPAADIFSRALESATSHQQTYQKPKAPRRHSRLIVTGAVSMLLLVSVAGIGYFNRSNIQMQFASAQAGFDARIPEFTPSGYSLRGISQEPGRVSVTYSASSFESTYIVYQQPSAWNSQTLLDTYITGTREDYKAIQRGGMTIYAYGQNNVTWVNGGVWYRIGVSGQGLTQDQLVQIATSIR